MNKEIKSDKSFSWQQKGVEIFRLKNGKILPTKLKQIEF